MDSLKEQITDLYDRKGRQRRLPVILRNAEPLQSFSSASPQSHSPKPLRLSIRTIRSHVVTCSPIKSDIITSAAHQTFTLANLPVEIFLLLLKYIPLSSVIALSLTCKAFQSLRSDYSEALSKNPFEKSLLLSLIAKDLPQQIACHSCNRLHNMEKAVRYYQAKNNGLAGFRQRPKALRCQLESTPCDMLDFERLIDDEFSPNLFQMAIKRWHHDPDCVQFLDIMSREITDEGGPDGWIKESQTDCRIVRGSFIHRAQKAWISDTNKPMLFGLSMDPCAHMEVFYINGCIYTKFHGLSIRSDDLPSHRIPFNCRKPETTLDLMKCNRCTAQCRVTMKNLAGRGIAIFITRWADLGSTVDDGKWKKYFFRDIFGSGCEPQPDSLFLSPAFENDGGFRSKVESRFYRRFPELLQTLPEE